MQVRSTPPWRRVPHGHTQSIIAAMATVLLMASCTGPAGAPKGSVPPAAVPAEVRLGSILPLTGAGSVWGVGMQKAAELLVRETNQAGGVLNRKLVLLSEDSQSAPEAGVRAAKKLIEVNRVSAIIGPWSSATTLAVVPVTIEAGVLEISVSGAATISLLKDNDLVWRTHPSQVHYGRVTSDVAIRQGWKTAVAMVQQNPALLSMGEEFSRNFAEKGGKVLGTVVYNPIQTSYKAEIEKALAMKPDGIMLGGYTPDNTIIFKEAYALGTGVKWIGAAFAINSQLVSNVGAAAVEGVYAVEFRPRIGSEVYAAFNAQFKADAGIDLADSPYACQTYDQVNVIALAMEAARSTDANVFKAQMRAINSGDGQVVHTFAAGRDLLRAGQRINYEGCSGRVDFDENGDVVTDMSVYQVRGGKLVEVDVIQN